MAFHNPTRSKRKPKMGAKAYPLRKIVGSKMVDLDDEYQIRHELLECGHTMRPRQDFGGETLAGSRRCNQCAAGVVSSQEGK